eukprot:GHVN01014959.1.p1 GENE.GHVN01014959.1~~GHVN01014959.1.p1  ORF type:complete len:503 (-),score=35.78 GHVN01014959.1:1040-2548(-)
MFGVSRAKGEESAPSGTSFGEDFRSQTGDLAFDVPSRQQQAGEGASIETKTSRASSPKHNSSNGRFVRGRTFDTPSRANPPKNPDYSGSDCTTSLAETCPDPLEPLEGPGFPSGPVGCSHAIAGCGNHCSDALCAPKDPRRVIAERGAVLLSQISVSRDELLELLKFVPIEMLMADPQETPSCTGRYPLCPIDLVCDRCPLPLMEEYCRKFLLRISRFYLVLLSTTVAIRVVVAADPSSKCYTVAVCRGIVGGSAYQLDGSWIGIAKNDTIRQETYVSIGMTMRLFAESLGKTCVKVPLHGVSNRTVGPSDLDKALNDLMNTGSQSKNQSSKDGIGSNDTEANDLSELQQTLADLEGRALALQYLRRFASCLETLIHLLPNFRAPPPAWVETDAPMQNPGEEDSGSFEEEPGENEEHRTRSVFEDPEMLGNEIEIPESERSLRDQARFLLKEMQTRLFEAAFISKQKSEHDIATVERHLKRGINCMDSNNDEETGGGTSHTP